MSFVQKIEKLSKPEVVAMSEKVKHDVMDLTQQLTKFKDTVSELNKSPTDDIKEMRKILYANPSYQKAAYQLLDFLRMTTRGAHEY